MQGELRDQFRLTGGTQILEQLGRGIQARAADDPLKLRPKVRITPQSFMSANGFSASNLFPSLFNHGMVFERRGCRLPVLMRGLCADRLRAEGAHANSWLGVQVAFRPLEVRPQSLALALLRFRIGRRIDRDGLSQHGGELPRGRATDRLLGSLQQQEPGCRVDG